MCGGAALYAEFEGLSTKLPLEKQTKQPPTSNYNATYLLGVGGGSTAGCLPVPAAVDVEATAVEAEAVEAEAVEAEAVEAGADQEPPATCVLIARV